MKFLEAYKDYIGDGSFNNVSEIDSDWVLKEPIKSGNDRCVLKNQEDVYDTYNNHIKTMQAHPEIFPKVKRLSKYRAAIERCNVHKAQSMFDKFLAKLPEEYSEIFTEVVFLMGGKLRDEILNYIKYNFLHDELCKKIYNFTLKVIAALGTCDFHMGNIGIDKKGELKLIDF